jgi:predicted PurR-regulated permease PerM
VIQPMVVKKLVGISPLVAIISLIIGGTLAGFLGVLISIPVAAVVMEFVNDVSKEKSLEQADADERKKEHIKARREEHKTIHENG